MPGGQPGKQTAADGMTGEYRQDRGDQRPAPRCASCRTGSRVSAAIVPRPRNIAPSESLTACAPSPRDVSHSATGGPFTPVDVVSTPVVNPSGTRTHPWPAGTRSRPRRTTSPNPITAMPTATCRTGLGSARSTSSPTTVPGAAATRIGATSLPRHGRPAMLGEQHEHVQHQPEPGRDDDRADRRQHREQDRRQHQREADTAGRLHAGGEQGSRCHQDQRHPAPEATDELRRFARVITAAPSTRKMRQMSHPIRAFASYKETGPNALPTTHMLASEITRPRARVPALNLRALARGSRSRAPGRGRGARRAPARRPHPRLRRRAPPGWASARSGLIVGVAFECISLAGYVALLALVAGRATPRVGIARKRSDHVCGSGCDATAPHRRRRRRRPGAVRAAAGRAQARGRHAHIAGLPGAPLLGVPDVDRRIRRRDRAGTRCTATALSP